MKNTNKYVLTGLASILMAACSSNSTKEGTGLNGTSRVLLDNSMKGKEMPDWTQTTKVSWQDGDAYIFKGVYTVRGDQRVNGCYDLSTMEIQQRILSDIENSLRIEMNLANEGISENTDAMITKSIQSNMAGKIRGLRITDHAFERYRVLNNERVDCFVLGQMKSTDYQTLRSSVLSQMTSASPEVAAIVRKRQADFFKDKNSDSVSTKEAISHKSEIKTTKESDNEIDQ